MVKGYREEQTLQEKGKSGGEWKSKSDSLAFSIEDPFMLNGESPIMPMGLKNILDLVLGCSLKGYCPSLGTPGVLATAPCGCKQRG